MKSEVKDEEILAKARESAEWKAAARRAMVAERSASLPEEKGEFWKKFLQVNSGLQASIEAGELSRAALDRAEGLFEDTVDRLTVKLNLMAGYKPIRNLEERIEILLGSAGLFAYGMERREFWKVIQEASDAGGLSPEEEDDLLRVDFLGVGTDVDTEERVCIAAAASRVVHRRVIARAARGARLWFQAVRAALEVDPGLLAEYLPAPPTGSRAVAVGFWMRISDVDEAERLGVRFGRVGWKP